MSKDRIHLHCALSHQYGKTRVLHDINLEIVRGQFVAMVGPSGCGKSTLLNCILGVLKPTVGSIAVFRGPNRVREEVTTSGRDRGIVYQDYTLFPNRTALENVVLGLRLSQTSIPGRLFHPFKTHTQKNLWREEAAALLDRVGLKQAKDKYPHQLSGGMRQRVALAQALVMKPEILLLDEPFGALDEPTRESLQRMLQEFYKENVAALERGAHPPFTLVIVTHSLYEAVVVSDRVVGLSQFWNWKDYGHAECPGATIVYDEVSPVYNPDTPEKLAIVNAQQRQLMEIISDKKRLLVRDERVQFWKQVEEGKGKGVLQR